MARGAAMREVRRGVSAEALARWIAGLGLVLLAVALYPHAGYGRLAGDGVIDAPMRRYLVTTSIFALLSGSYVLAVDTLPGRRLKYRVGVTLVTVLLLELAAAIGLKLATGRYHLTPESGAFTYHPALVGLPTPAYCRGAGRRMVCHNAAGFRGAELDQWWRAGSRVAAVGGSSTYDVGVYDDQAWVARLERHLGDGVATLNMGVPGHSTAEHVILTGLLASEFRPDVILYYVGWNDIANSHLATLKADYSDPHFLSQFAGLQLDWGQFSASALLTITKRVLSTAGLIDSPYARRHLEGGMHRGVDERLLAVYERNLRLLVAMARTICAEPVLIPQVLNQQVAQPEATSEWIPYLRHEDVWPVMAVFNERLIQIGGETGTPVVTAVLEVPWRATDFVDSGHFSPSGADKFARTVADAVGRHLGGLAARPAASPGCAARGPGSSAAR